MCPLFLVQAAELTSGMLVVAVSLLFGYTAPRLPSASSFAYAKLPSQQRVVPLRLREASESDGAQQLPSPFTFPCLTLVAAATGLAAPKACAPLGSIAFLSGGLSVLMLSMGLSLTPADLRRALLSPKELVLNLLLCFGAMPLVALALAKLFHLSAGTAAGLVLLGSVSGGQASNLCALLAGGDLALSVVLTVATTLIGVVATPTLVQLLLGTSLTVDAVGVLRSIASLVLAPLTVGLVAGRVLPAVVRAIQDYLPRVGIAALLVLVAGGSANAATLLLGSSGAWKAHLGSILLPIVGGAVALAAARLACLNERAVRTLVIETAIKSPTLAFVLAKKHFVDPATAAAPAASMIYLAAIGAAVASAWSRIDPPPPAPSDNAQQ